MNPRQKRLSEGILFTDLYQLTMAQLYFRHGLHERRAHFDHFFRSYPDYGEHQAGFCLNAGMGTLVEWMEQARFTEEDLEALGGERAPSGAPLFGADFLDYLRRHGTFEGLILTAIPEGRVVHAGVPLTVVEGPLAMAQILETALLNTLNFQTLIATKAARIRQTLDGNQLVEFGMRRAQGRGAIEGSRAALIGGCDATSNTGLSLGLGLSPRGTHAHSLIQAFLALGMEEVDAFRAYADLYPESCTLLVDTVDTLHSGVPNAIRVFEELRRRGFAPVAVRLDSGDFAYLSIQTARMLDEAGFPEVGIVLSNELDELTIWQIQDQIREEAPRYGVDPAALERRLVYGVGTRLITSQGRPALGGVYKLVALEDRGGWRPAIKLSESASKIPNPGRKRVWRLVDQRGIATADLLGLEEEDPAGAGEIHLHHPTEKGVVRCLRAEELSRIEALLEPVPRARDYPDLEALRARRRIDLGQLDPGVRRLRNPHIYHVSLTSALLEMKESLIESYRGLAGRRAAPPAPAGPPDRVGGGAPPVAWGDPEAGEGG